MTKPIVSVNMKLIALLPFLFIFFQANCLVNDSSSGTKVNRFARGEIYLKVANPVYIDVSEHYKLYGILGPESFISYVTLKVLDNNGDTSIADKIVLGINDYQAQQLNSIQESGIYIEVASTFGDYAEFDSKVYRLMNITDRNTFLSHRINDLFWIRSHLPEYSQFQLKVKSKSVSASISAIARLTINDSIEKDTLITYEAVEPVDSMATAIFGKTLYVLKSDYTLKSEHPNCIIIVKQTALRIDNGISKEMLYEVISVYPVEE